MKLLLLCLLLVVVVNSQKQNHYTDFYTGDSLAYNFFPINSKYLHFKVKAANDVHVGLFSKTREVSPWYEIVIGGWANTRSVIRKDKGPAREGQVVNSITPEILKDREYTELWINFSGRMISVGVGGEKDPFMVWRNDKRLPDFKYMGVHTGFGSTGYWTIYFNENAGKNEIDVRS